MTEQKQILRNHYLALGRKLATWVGLIAIIATTVVPLGANAAQFSARKAILSDSGAGSTGVSIDMFDTIPSTATTIKAIRYQFCTTPLYNTACSLPVGLVRGTTIVAQNYAGSAISAQPFTAATSGTTDVLLSNATGTSMVSPNILEIKLSGFTNPTTANQEFYIRVETCTTTTCTIPTDVDDEGSMAVSTTQVLGETANVQEDLTFCVGTAITGNCTTATGSTLTLSPNPMTVSAPSTGTAKMAASTNGTSGYTITYNGTSFTDTSADTICTSTCVTNLAAGQTINAGGTEQFGFNLVANSGGSFGTIGTAASGGIGAASSPYATNNQLAYVVGSGTACATAAGPTSQTTYTMSFGANIGTTTKPGTYTATQTFIATASF